MSTLGRRAAKKMLDRLRKDSIIQMERYMKLINELKDTNFSPKVKKLVDSAHEAMLRFMRYIISLEDYREELDEAWDNISKRMEQAVKEIPSPKKEKKKKTSYIG